MLFIHKSRNEHIVLLIGHSNEQKMIQGFPKHIFFLFKCNDTKEEWSFYYFQTFDMISQL